MNKKQIKKIVKKNVKVAKAKGAQLKAVAKIGYDQLKKEMKISPKKAKELEAKALKEYNKIKKQMDTTAKKVEGYVKKNPEKAATISAGIGMALGAVAGLLAGSNIKGKKKKR